MKQSGTYTKILFRVLDYDIGMKDPKRKSTLVHF